MWLSLYGHSKPSSLWRSDPQIPSGMEASLPIGRNIKEQAVLPYPALIIPTWEEQIPHFYAFSSCRYGRNINISTRCVLEPETWDF